ncbi:hypothetical protein [Sorangium sp. So ce861]|uniref:hypothetical protein n=1 Tax=Sorangium sp. So ce861 TaxID=3133323 RepID=UPI003F6288FF
MYLAAPLVLLACGADASGEAGVVSEAHALAGGGHCAAGLLQNPETQQCAPIADRRAEAQRAAARRPERLPPNLTALRGAAGGAPRAARSHVSVPDHVPGGLGAGVSYKSGALPVTESSTLYTHMIVYPEGLGFDVPTDLFTTATNRTEKTVEVVGWYREASVHHIGIFDWSCSATDPCAGGQTVPSWIWTRPFSDNTCQLTQMADDAGVNHETLYYANATVSTHTVKYAGVLASASRPRWRASASDRALRSQKSLRRRTKTPLRNARVAAIDRGPSSCAAHLRSMSSSAQLARGG